MLTCQQAKVAFKLVLDEVGFQLQDDEPLYKVLKMRGFDHIHHLLTMSLADVDALTYKNVAKQDVSIPAHHWAWIHILQEYHFHRTEQGDPIRDGW
jgi:hypothetical protein